MTLRTMPGCCASGAASSAIGAPIAWVQRWEWQFDANPFRLGPQGREPVILLAIAAGEVVGHVSGVPIPIRIHGTASEVDREGSTVLAASGLVVDEGPSLGGVPPGACALCGRPRCWPTPCPRGAARAHDAMRRQAGAGERAPLHLPAQLCRGSRRQDPLAFAACALPSCSRAILSCVIAPSVRA